MSTDYRTLCAELVEAWDATADFDFNDFGHAAADIVTRARAALAEQPVVPTRQEAVDLYSEVMAAHDCQTLGEMAEHFARAVLAPPKFTPFWREVWREVWRPMAAAVSTHF